MANDYISKFTGDQIDLAVGAVNDVDNKVQGKLTAGTNITISSDNIISAETGITQVSWGEISGNIEDQKDLQTVLQTQTDSIVNIEQELNKKQPTLVSGENIKTINGNSILGSGNIDISGGGGTTVVANPSLTGTEAQLKGIQIGNIKYSVADSITNDQINGLFGNDIIFYISFTDETQSLPPDAVAYVRIDEAMDSQNPPTKYDYKVDPHAKKVYDFSNNDVTEQLKSGINLVGVRRVYWTDASAVNIITAEYVPMLTEYDSGDILVYPDYVTNKELGLLVSPATVSTVSVEEPTSAT